MKFIFDFDDVLFYTTRRRVEYIYPFLEKLGISRQKVDEYYKEVRGQNFSMKKLLKYFSLPEETYEEIMRDSIDFSNKETINFLKKAGKENCFIITYGDEEFQLDKIKRTGVDTLVSEIIVVSTDEKKEFIEVICEKYKNEKIVFIDDKAKHFENLDLQKCPNLKTILYTGQNLESYFQ